MLLYDYFNLFNIRKPTNWFNFNTPLPGIDPTVVSVVAISYSWVN